VSGHSSTPLRHANPKGANLLNRICVVLNNIYVLYTAHSVLALLGFPPVLQEVRDESLPSRARSDLRVYIHDYITRPSFTTPNVTYFGL